MNPSITAIVLAAGSGTRMGSSVRKQYLDLGGIPLVVHSLSAFQESALISEIILVCARGEEDWCRDNLVRPYSLSKVRKIVPGGKERYHSVWEGLCAVSPCDIIMIHDGARPFVTEEMLNRLASEAAAEGACVAAVPVKDTIKLADEEGYVAETPPRNRLWTVQTPQVFDYKIVYEAYRQLISLEETCMAEGRPVPVAVTDDAMVVETFGGHRVKLVTGSYENIKITTPEDLPVAEALLRRK